MNEEDRKLGERIKATTLAIMEFDAARARPELRESILRTVESMRSYPIASRRHIAAMRSELEAAVRDVRSQVADGLWKPQTFARLVEELKARDLIDVSLMPDKDGMRIERMLQAGKIKTPAQLQLAKEYRDTVTDDEVIEQLDELIADFESHRDVNANTSLPATLRKPKLSKAALSAEEQAYLDLLRRSAVAVIEYASKHGDDKVRGKPAMQEWINTWRSLDITTQEDLRKADRGFWGLVSDFRRFRLPPGEFEKMAAQLKADQLLDVSQSRSGPRKSS